MSKDLCKDAPAVVTQSKSKKSQGTNTSNTIKTVFESVYDYLR